MVDFLIISVIVILAVMYGLGMIIEEIAKWRLMFAKSKRKAEIATGTVKPDVVTDHYTFEEER
ncbi:hypothetical protein [Corynebacterium jeikeium]|uniref:hypothetical protein n=1 Tax=Corynebacterium jeikeium TaxID=38289 RepID=UPI000556C4C0|nr:hypothetical protein [Corynebacterium jeikeium]